MSAEFWAIIGVGVALAGLQWRVYVGLGARISRVEARVNDADRRLARIEG